MSEAINPSFNYAILVESGCQWDMQLYFNGDIIDMNDVAKEPFFINLYARGVTIQSFRYEGIDWYGYHISEAEAKRIERMIELYPAHSEYNKLAASNI